MMADARRPSSLFRRSARQIRVRLSRGFRRPRSIRWLELASALATRLQPEQEGPGKYGGCSLGSGCSLPTLRVGAASPIFLRPRYALASEPGAPCSFVVNERFPSTLWRCSGPYGGDSLLCER